MFPNFKWSDPHCRILADFSYPEFLESRNLDLFLLGFQIRSLPFQKLNLLDGFWKQFENQTEFEKKNCFLDAV